MVENAVIRYGQVWEDADVLLEALDVGPGDVCLSIASAGDNALALLTRGPARVVAVDVNAAQLACLELRVAAFRELAYPELLELLGSRESTRRGALYARCRPSLSPHARALWDARPDAIEHGIASSGRFERYLALFREAVLPLVHESAASLLQPRTATERAQFYAERWNSWRWRLLFRIFFSRPVMATLGRDRRFFRQVTGGVAARLLERTRHGLTSVDPSTNPYVRWILTGKHDGGLPCAFRQEHYETIRANLHRLSWHHCSLERLLETTGRAAFDRFNLSDVFEYVSLERYHGMLELILRAGRPGARLVYWNMLVPRRRPEAMADRLAALDALASRLHARDRVFFYSALRVEELR